MRPDPLLPRLRSVADMLMLPGVSIYDMYPRLSTFDHVIYVYPRRSEWHVIIEPPVVVDCDFHGIGALRIETDLAGACEAAIIIAKAARNAGRSVIVVTGASEVRATPSEACFGRRL